MLAFYFRRTLHSLRRTPVLSSVMIINMALGLAVWIIAYTAVAVHGRVPIAYRGTLLHVDWGTTPELDLDGLEIYQRVQARAPHTLLSHRDAARLARHPAVRRSARTFTSRLTVHSPRGPEVTAARFATGELFSMFQLPFRFGGAWREAEAALRPEIVLDHASNRHFFGGKNSVGRSLAIDDQEFRVVGVLAPTPTRVRAYDLSFSLAPAIYLPFGYAAPLGARPDFNAHRSLHGPGIDEFMASDDGAVQLWVELASPDRRAEYESWLHAAGAAGRAQGQRQQQRPMLQSPAEFMQNSVPIPNGFFLFRACAFIALLACIVNLSRLLIVKFQARAPELAVQRALGATRQSVFAQHMLEAVLVALAAIVLGLLIAVLGLIGINAVVPDRPADFSVDAQGVLMACAVGLGAGLLAGVHPAIRMCRSAPAAFLRLQ